MHSPVLLQFVPALGTAGDPNSSGVPADLLLSPALRGPDSESGPASGSGAERPLPAGVHYVFDAAVAADLSILEGQKEFVRRFLRHSEEDPALPMLTSACPGECRGQLPGPSCLRPLSQGSVCLGQAGAVGAS